MAEPQSWVRVGSSTATDTTTALKEAQALVLGTLGGLGFR